MPTRVLQATPPSKSAAPAFNVHGSAKGLPLRSYTPPRSFAAFLTSLGATQHKAP